MKKQALFEEFNYFCSTAILPARKAKHFSISSFNILAINRHKPKSVIIKTGVFLSLLILIILGSSCNNSEPEGKELPRVYIKETKGKYQLIRNGKPFYMHGAAAHSDFLEELKEAGANTARIYDTINLKATLDKAHELGLAVVVDIPLPKFDRTPEFFENEQKFSLIYKNVQRLVKDNRNHPALLYWNLGNEIFYPYLYTRTKFYENYNSLIDLVHKLDPNHPVSTSTIGANKLEVISITIKSPQLDFISFNSFGTLNLFEKKLRPITPLWNGPHVITEWGVNGPWEAVETSWGAPIEETSTKKAEQITQRYAEYIEPLKNKNSIGNFIFYWGYKNEVTPTWYSLFDINHLKSQAVFELENIWKDKQENFPGPVLDYILLEDKGAFDNIILTPSTPATAEIFFPETAVKNYVFYWEVREESWYNLLKSSIVSGVDLWQKDHSVNFLTPSNEGPYRLHLTITNNTGYYASANIPFYVLNPKNEE